jgi:uncharacterized protein with HEPN domain
MSTDRRADWLADIVENCDRIARHVAGQTRDSYCADEKTIDAVERCLQRICEAATRLRHDEIRGDAGPSLETLYAEVPWDDVRGMGDILRHKYDRVDDDLVWTTISEKLSPLREAAAREIARRKRSGVG